MFSYTGGFSIYALKSGAREVHSLDSSQRALDVCEDNVKLNGLNPSSTGPSKRTQWNFSKPMRSATMT